MLAQYAVETFSMQDSIVHREINNLGLKCTWLVTREYKRTRHGSRCIISSVFPGYVFAEFDQRVDYWKRIASCRGVKAILGPAPDQPKALPIGTLEEIISRFTAGEFNKTKIITPPTEPIIQHSDRAQITEGSNILINIGTLAAPRLIPGICKLNAKERMRVLFEFLGESREANVSLDRITIPNNLTSSP